VTEDYKDLCIGLRSLTENERHIIPNLANASALIWQNLPRINWAGFYIAEPEGYLLLGPFQGKPACIRIPSGKGVCGTAYKEDKTQLVKDVHEFPGHIACDSASNSEIVIPIHNKDNQVAAVLDIDSPVLNRFTEADKEGLEAFVKILEEACDW
jgi:GAF domain-containing protein